MKITYLINAKSKTSVPMQWIEYVNDFYKNELDVNLLALKNLDLKRIPNLIKSKIIHGHHIKSMYLYLMFNKILSKKTVYTVHGSYLYLSDENKKLLNFIFKNVDKIIFVNKFLYDVLPQALKNLIQNKYEIILNGVETNFKYKKVDIYEKFKLNKEDILIFHPARFVKEKNHLKVIEAFSLLVKNNSKVKLILAGDGKLRNEIENKVKELNLEDKVILLGFIDRNDVFNFLEASEIFIMPSVSEGLNISFLEALVMRKKILVSNVEQFTYIFKHYKIKPKDYNTFFVDPYDIENIFKGLDNLLSFTANKKFDITMFSLDNMFNKYFDLYRDLLDDN